MKITCTRGSQVKLHVEFEETDYYNERSNGGVIKELNVSGPTLLEALMKMLDRMHISTLDSDYIREEGMTVEDILREIEDSNLDYGDFIFYLENMTTGEVLIDYRDQMHQEEDDWDQEEDEDWWD